MWFWFVVKKNFQACSKCNCVLLGRMFGRKSRDCEEQKSGQIYTKLAKIAKRHEYFFDYCKI
jgi:hypothetical protein